ncbi:MAG: FAD-dependent oxidoreductase [Saprospiraceae bacterium]
MSDSKPIIFCIDDDKQVLRAVMRDVRDQFKKKYRIMGTTSAQEALDTLELLKKKSEEVALFLSDQRMPEMLGVEFLEKAMKLYPGAQRVLLTAYSDTEAAIKAINAVQLDYYLLKPWDPPEEKLYPVLQELLFDWKANHKPEGSGIRVVGYPYSPKSHAIKDFLSGNLIPYTFIDVESDDRAYEILQLHDRSGSELPVVITAEGEPLCSPTIPVLAKALGLSATTKEDVYDLVIIGGGPAGLAAAVYAGSEGLKAVLIEKRAPGGQAGTSSRIENYLGFPNGLSGSDLTHRAISQVKRFGVEIVTPAEVNVIESNGQFKKLTLSNGNTVNTKAVVVTTGVQYRELEAKGIRDFSGAGIYYGAAMTEAATCKDKTVYVVGGGNSAGQGAVYLSKFAKQVYISIRREDLTSSMSSYLIDQINNIDNIEIISKTQIIEALGSDDKLERLSIQDLKNDQVEEKEANALFIFIGAKPYTDWLDGVIKDDKGFVITGRDVSRSDRSNQVWKLDRDPYLLETSIPGVFAAGDVRSGAMNRVASAVGEGAMAISFVHQYLAEA